MPKKNSSPRRFQILGISLGLFDLILAGVVLFLAVFFFLFFYRKGEYVDIRVKVTDQDVLYANAKPTSGYARHFTVGDIEKDAIGQVISQITAVENFEVPSGGGTTRRSLYVDLRVKATYDSRTQTYSSRGKVLAFGIPMRFRLNRVTFDCFITEFPGSEMFAPDEVGEVTVQAIQRNMEPAVAAAIHQGDVFKNSRGDVLASVEKIDVTPAEVVTQTDSGELLLRKSPLNKDVLVTLRLRTRTYQGERVVLDDLPVRVGQEVPILLPQVNFYPMITLVE